MAAEEEEEGVQSSSSQALGMLDMVDCGDVAGEE
jgi:hypothetical protein